MTEKEYNICLGKILSGNPLNEKDAQSFMVTLSQMESLLDQGDHDDVFGTEGWRHLMGWD